MSKYNKLRIQYVNHNKKEKNKNIKYNKLQDNTKKYYKILKIPIKPEYNIFKHKLLHLDDSIFKNYKY